MSKRVWVSWETHRRNQTTSKALGAKLFELDYYKASSLMRYLRATITTVFLLVRERPSLIFVQNPSMLLAVLALQFGRLFRTSVIVDGHNAGLYPFDGKKYWANQLARHIMRSAALTIVTNSGLAEYVKKNGGRPAVLPDPLPTFIFKQRATPLKGRVNILFICTWASDEPYMEMMTAAAYLDKSICIYITGNSKGRETAFGKPLPENIVLTGYVAEEEYVHLLHAVDIIIDLTTRDNCLVCGAYEAIAVEKPLILSDTPAIREYFSHGVLYTDNTALDIARQIHDCLERIEEIQNQVKQFKQDLITQWECIRRDLQITIQSLEKRV